MIMNFFLLSEIKNLVLERFYISELLPDLITMRIKFSL